MTWWCSARGTAWDWTWQAYPGVWLFGALLIIGYLGAHRRWHPDPLIGDEPRRKARRVVAYVLGVGLLWMAADWPVGPLGAGYLVSVHTVQYLTFAMIAPPLLIYGTSPWVLRGVLRSRAVWSLLRALTRPLPAFLVFNTVMLATHLPAMVDGLSGSQGGSFLIHMAWLGSGIVFWWVVLGPLPELGPLPYPGRILFLVLNVFIPTVPASFLTFADYPIYGLYELAPSVGAITARTDQQLAGLMMKLVGGFIIFGTASVLFFRWFQREDDPSASLAIPADPVRQ